MPTQYTQNVKPKLYYCWHSIVDNNPTNTKHLYNIYTMSAKRLRRWSNIVQMLYKCLCLLGIQNWMNVLCLLGIYYLAHRIRSGHRIIAIYLTQGDDLMLAQCWDNTGEDGPTSKRRWGNVYSLLWNY